MIAAVANRTDSNYRRLVFLIAAGSICAVGFLLVALAGNIFYRTLPVESYLVFHLIAEFASIVVSFGVFTTGWYGYKQRPDTYILVVSLVFFAVGLLDFVHALSYEGMPAFLSQNSASKAATYWIAARLTAGVGLLSIALTPETELPGQLHPRMLLGLVLSFVVGLVLVESYAPQTIPAMFVEGKGLTPVKTTLEYFIIAIYVAAIVALWHKSVFKLDATIYLQTALLIGIFSELAFTLYANVYDSYNFLGHVYKVASYYLILRAVFVSSLKQPYLELNRSREDLEQSFESIGTALASSLELDETLKLIAKLASDMLHSPYALVALQEENPTSLVIRATYGIDKPSAEIPLDDNLVNIVIKKRQPVLISDISELKVNHPFLLPGQSLNSAIAVPILKNSTVLGVLAVYSTKTKAFRDSHARLLAAFARQAAVAITNARLYKNQLDTGIKLQNYAAQLSILHQIGISLNRETNQRKLLEIVLKGAVELTSAGVGILWLITDEQTDVVSLYYPPWFQKRCQIEQPVKFHQAISQLVEKKGKDVVRFTNLSDLSTQPPGHLQLQGLMIATVRDLRGNIRGHFMLSNKHEGADFTLEDEEIISLLAAQCSVALTSAENFEREHYVAESLQTALLPEKPSRDDVEVGLLYRSAAPFAKVGGDFYDFVELDKNRIAVTVGDVCGKGLEAATYTAMIKYMLRAYLGENMLPGDCLTRLNRAVYKQISAEKFITMGLAIIDTEKGIVNYSSSGHPPPFICKKGKANPLPTPPAVPLGVLPNHPFLSSQISLAGACAIFMYTDGLIEARPPEGEPFGEKRLSETVAGYCCLPAQQVADKIAQAALEYSGGILRDDIAILVVRLLKPHFNKQNDHSILSASSK